MKHCHYMLGAYCSLLRPIKNAMFDKSSGLYYHKNEKIIRSSGEYTLSRGYYVTNHAQEIVWAREGFHIRRTWTPKTLRETTDMVETGHFSVYSWVFK